MRICRPSSWNGPLSLLRNGLHYRARVWLGSRGETLGTGGRSMERFLDGDPLISPANTEVGGRESEWQSGCLPVPWGRGFWDQLLRLGVSGAAQGQAHLHNIRDHRKTMGASQGVPWRCEVPVVSRGSSRARLQSRKNPANQSLARLQTKTSREGGLPLPGGSVITRRVCERVLSRAVEARKLVSCSKEGNILFTNVRQQLAYSKEWSHRCWLWLVENLTCFLVGLL